MSEQLAAEDGYRGVAEVRTITPATRTQITLLATRTHNIKGGRIRELTTLIQEQFKLPDGTVEVVIEVTCMAVN